MRCNIGKVIQAKNYTGLIQTKSRTQIQILPKIEQTSDYDTKNIFIKMLRSMKDLLAKVFNDTSIKLDQINLHEILINMYIQEVHTLVKKGFDMLILIKSQISASAGAHCPVTSYFSGSCYSSLCTYICYH